MRPIFATMIGAIAIGAVGVALAEVMAVAQPSSMVPGPAGVDASFPKKPGNYFRIYQKGNDQAIVIAVVPVSEGKETKAVQGILNGAEALNGHLVDFGACGALKLGNLNAVTTRLTPSPKEVLVLDGELESTCGIDPTPRVLQRMPE